MLQSVAKRIKKIAHVMSKALESYERLCKILFRQSSELRYMFYCLSFCLITKYYTTSALFQSCGVLFLLYSIIDFCVQKGRFSAKTKHHSFTILNTCLFTASCVVLYVIAEMLQYYYCNYYTLFSNAKNLVCNHPTLIKRLFYLGKIVAIPISTISTIYYKYSQYVKLPSYQSVPQRVSIFDGTAVKSDIMRENLQIPVWQLVSLAINAVTTRNPISALVTLMDVLMLFTTYAGHKSRFFY